MNNIPIVITSFCRPNLTANAINSLLDSSPNSEIIVSHDGPIRGFFESEHAATREMLIRLASSNPQLRLNLRDENFGLVPHLSQIFVKVFEEYDNLIFLEEDMLLEKSGIAFLSEIKDDLDLSHRTAYSSTNHPETNNINDWRLSYFPEQWGVSINRIAFDAFQSEVSYKKVERSIVRKVILNSGYSRLVGETLTDFWTDLLRKEIISPHGWDAIFQLMLWRNSSPSKVSIRNFVTDTGGGRGAITSRNVRTTNSMNDVHNRYSKSICIECEKQDAQRRNFSSTSQIRSRLRIRSRVKQYFDDLKFM